MQPQLLPGKAEMDALSALTEEERSRLLGCAHRIAYTEGDIILQEGSARRAIFIVREGAVRVEKEHLGEGIPVDELGAGEVFGEMSFLENSTASASVVADGSVEVDVLDESDVLELLKADPLLAAHFYRSIALTLSRRLRHSTSELTSIPFSWG
jgi:CRP-like cAMP-binding protein